MPFKEAQENTSGADYRKRLPEEIEALGFSDAEITALKRQGSVIRESRGASVVFRLRFRMSGRLRTKYIGTEEAHAIRIEQLLTQLQQRRWITKQLREVEDASKVFRRESKKRLEPFLKSAGLKFHGNTIRRARLPMGTPMNQSTQKKKGC